ncbi:hypothetical protein MARI151_10158 [Maribacter litoralis]|uniref:Uncharacterized protein n=1 Tax=Maribacter litoralis TaxID=2059726 RepID=A0A653LYH9_9FLAO|nr:hypothetical protein MARI151_10158 [Maribacter litoralis]
MIPMKLRINTSEQIIYKNEQENNTKSIGHAHHRKSRPCPID